MYMRVFVLLVLSVLPVELYRIIGWKCDFYKQNTHRVKTSKRFGDQSDEGGEWITWGDWECWTGSVYGFCKVRLKVTNENGKEHFQVQGSSYDVYDTSSSIYCNTHTNGDLSGEKHEIAEGKAWNSCRNGWGYNYLRLFGVMTTEMPLIGAFSYQKMNSRDQKKKLTEVVIGDKGEYDTMVEVDSFRSHSDAFSSNTVIKLRYWIPPTSLIDFEAHFGDMSVKDILSTVASYRIIKNEGCGDQGTWESGMTGSQTDTLEVTLTSTVGWSSTYTYSFSIEASVATDIGLIATEITSTSGFSFETSESFEQTQSLTKTTEYKWPTYCPTGLKCKSELVRVTSETILPVTLTFQRGKDTYTEENHMKSHMQATQENDSEEPIEGFVDPCGRK